MIYCCNVLPSDSLLESIAQIATIVIAAVNLVFAVFVFRINSKKKENQLIKDRNIDLLKTIILDQNLNELYIFFDDLEEGLSSLSTSGLNDNQKQAIVDMTGDLFIKVRRKFTDTLLAIDLKLYNEVLKESDELQDRLINSIFNPGLNLSHSPMMDSEILVPITRTKTNMLKILFRYRG